MQALGEEPPGGGLDAERRDPGPEAPQGDRDLELLGQGNNLKGGVQVRTSSPADEEPGERDAGDEADSEAPVPPDVHVEGLAHIVHRKGRQLDHKVDREGHSVDQVGLKAAGFLLGRTAGGIRLRRVPRSPRWHRLWSGRNVIAGEG